MYELSKRAVASLLRVPTEPPEPPAGSYASVQVFRASPRYLSYKLLSLWVAAAIEAVVLLAALVGGIAAGPVAAVGAILLAIPLGLATLAGWFVVRIDYDLRYYVLTDRSLRIREGAWTVSEITLTHANVQNLRIAQGPLQRLFGIADVIVDTAGGAGPAASDQLGSSGHHASLAGLENAAQVRDLIRAHMRARRPDAGLGDPDDARRPAAEGALAAPGSLAALREVRASAAALRRTAEGVR